MSRFDGDQFAADSLAVAPDEAAEREVVGRAVRDPDPEADATLSRRMLAWWDFDPDEQRCVWPGGPFKLFRRSGRRGIVVGSIRTLVEDVFRGPASPPARAMVDGYSRLYASLWTGLAEGDLSLLDVEQDEPRAA